MRNFLVLFLCILVANLDSQNISFNQKLPLYNRAVIWRGFDHTWTYNHRINRLGSYVFIDSTGIPKGTHYSASGLGADSTDYEIYYSYVEHPKLFFFQGVAKVLVTGKETLLLTENQEISVVVPEWFRNKSRYNSIINGFEIKSLEKSDQPVHFLANIDDPIYSNTSGEMKFKVQFNWAGNCRSAECEIFKNTTTYELTIHYLLVGYNTDDAIAFQFLNTNSYSWGTEFEVPNHPIKKKFGVEPNKFNHSIIGIKSFGFSLYEEQWMQELNYKVDIDNYYKERGEVDASVHMLFLDWKEGMKRRSARKASSVFAHKKSGWVNMNLTSLILQSNYEKVYHGESIGSLFWRGRNISSSSKEAEDTQILNFKF